MRPTALLIHVPDIEKGIAWYKKAFPDAIQKRLIEFDFTVLVIDDFQIEVVQADEKVGSGKKGTVLYWAVDNIDAERSRLEKLGAKLYRGPMTIEDGLVMCQLEDPFGNLIGLRGPSPSTVS
ncbi:MAG: VOC family protein [Chloroflexota bacterium]